MNRVSMLLRRIRGPRQVTPEGPWRCEDCGAICPNYAMAGVHSDRWLHSLGLARFPGEHLTTEEEMLACVEVEFQCGDLTNEKYLDELRRFGAGPTQVM